MSKSQDAFRTISEVSDLLDTPAHVLRFWESKFAQVKPVKRAGGRRYYRPTDVDLLAGIKKLLHVDGMTIKGAQKLMREQGVKHVAQIGAGILGAPAPKPEAEPVEHQTTRQETEPTSTAAPSPTSEPIAARQADGQSKDQAEDQAGQAQAASSPAPLPHISISHIPADPADSDSKAPARVFHLLRKAQPEALAQRAAQIAPLLERMRALRGRIALH